MNTVVAVADLPSPQRDALAGVLESGDHHTVAPISSVDELSAAAERVDVLLLGDGLRRELPVDAIGALLRGGVRVLLVISAQLDASAAAFLLAGASGAVIIDDLTPADLIAAVDAVASGQSALHPTVARAVLEQWRAQRNGPSTVTLTSRERDVLHGLRDGLTVRLIARRLGVAEKTVEAHRSRLFTKLGARNQTHAVALATERGLFDPE